MKYIVSAMSIVNNILYADGRKINEVTGGGLFMLGGVMSLDPSVAFVTAAGDDFEKFHGKYFRAHRLGYEGIHRTLPYTHYTDLIYSADGSWTERSIYGDTYMEEHAQDTMVHASWIAELAGDDTAAVYTESGAEEIFWNDASTLRLRLLSTCWKDSKILERSSSLMPIPESVTAILSMMRPPSSRSKSTPMRTKPWLVNLTALFKRFIRTCCRRT